MKEEIFDQNGVLSIGSFHGEEDFKPWLEKAVQAIEEAEMHEDPAAWLREKYGVEVGVTYYILSCYYDTKRKSWSKGSVYGEEDLKPKGVISINPPPSDGKCDCCGLPISQLKPFGKAGDPCVGDFDGAYLIKSYRPDGPYNEEAEQAYLEAEKHGDPQAWLRDKYGEEESEMISLRVSAHGSVGKSWECRDCITLSTNEYFEKLYPADEALKNNG